MGIVKEFLYRMIYKHDSCFVTWKHIYSDRLVEVWRRASPDCESAQMPNIPDEATTTQITTTLASEQANEEAVTTPTAAEEKTKQIPPGQSKKG